MTDFASWSIPLFIIGVIVFALFKKGDVWQAFTKGGAKGLKTAVDIFPSLLGLVVAIELLSQSGALKAFSELFAPISGAVGIPKEIFPLSLMRSVSGSGSMAVYQNIITAHSPDSYIGRTASVIMGSTETTFYTMSIYFAATKAKGVRYCLFCALVADLTSSIVASFLCRFI